MVVVNFYFVGIPVIESKTETPLIVDPNRMLTLAFPVKGMELVRRRQSHVLQPGRGIKLPQSHSGSLLDILRQAPRLSGCEELLGLGVGERSDHRCQM
jgi:hypothetical protein